MSAAQRPNPAAARIAAAWNAPRVGAAEKWLKNGRSDDRRAKRPTELLCGAEHARRSAGIAGRDCGEHHVDQRNDEESQASTREEQPGHERPWPRSSSKVVRADDHANDAEHEQQAAGRQDAPSMALGQSRCLGSGKYATGTESKQGQSCSQRR